MEDLPILEKVVIEPSAEQRIGPNGIDLVKIREEIGEEVDYRPGKLFRRQFIRPVYASPAKTCAPRIAVPTSLAIRTEKHLSPEALGVRELDDGVVGEVLREGGGTAGDPDLVGEGVGFRARCQDDWSRGRGKGGGHGVGCAGGPVNQGYKWRQCGNLW